MDILMHFGSAGAGRTSSFGVYVCLNRHEAVSKWVVDVDTESAERVPHVSPVRCFRCIPKDLIGPCCSFPDLGHGDTFRTSIPHVY